MTLEQINSIAELLAALQRRRVRLLLPDQALSLLSPAVSRLALFFLHWAMPTARLDWVLPAALRSLLLQDRLPRAQRAHLLAFLIQIGMFRGELDPAVQAVVETFVETCGFGEKEAVFLAVFLPIATLRAVLPRFKMEFQGAPRCTQAEMASHVIGCCAMLRSLIGRSDKREQRQKLDLFERLLESCVLMAAENGSANVVGSVVVSYWVVQFYNESIRQHVFIPSEEVVRILSMSDNAINHTVKLTVKDGKYYITLDLKGLDLNGQLGYLGGLKYFLTGYTQDSYGNPQGELADAVIESYQLNADGSRVSDDYGTDYPDQVTFELIPEALEDGYAPLQVFVPLMGAEESEEILAVWRKADESPPLRHFIRWL